MRLPEPARVAWVRDGLGRVQQGAVAHLLELLYDDLLLNPVLPPEQPLRTHTSTARTTHADVRDLPCSVVCCSGLLSEDTHAPWCCCVLKHPQEHKRTVWTRGGAQPRAHLVHVAERALPEHGALLQRLHAEPA